VVSSVLSNTSRPLALIAVLLPFDLRPLSERSAAGGVPLYRFATAFFEPPLSAPEDPERQQGNERAATQECKTNAGCFGNHG
jgi:hypothetical protein